MYSLTVENERGKQLYLTNNKNYIIKKVTGLTPPSSNVNVAKVVNQDGGNFNSSSMNVRNLVIYIKPLFPVEENRIALYEYFKSKRWIKIYYKNGTRNVYIEGIVEDIDGDLFELGQTIQISIICPDPYFKNLSEMIVDISKVTALFEFPFAIEKEGIPFSEFNEYLIGKVVNEGDSVSGLKIELTCNGTVVNPVIYNADNRDYFGINITMQPSDLIVINTIIGQTQITLTRNGVKTNIINLVKDGTTWFQVEAGTSFYTYVVDSGLDNLTVKFTPHTIFEGV